MNKKITKTVGVIAPSRPIYTRQSEFDAGLEILHSWGIKTILSKNIKAHDFYSAGTPQQRADDLNEIFANPEVDLVICATGGITSNQILKLLNYEMIKASTKQIIGYSDNTNILFAINKIAGNQTYYGPDICELHNLDENALEAYKNFLLNSEINLPSGFSTIKPGRGDGKLIGGNLFSICGLLSSKYIPSLDGSILFWEDCGISPAHIDFHLNQLKLSGKIENLSGMIIGHLEDCIDKKYPQDNKSLAEIANSVFSNYDFPIIQVNYFGHEIDNFHIIPVEYECLIDTSKQKFELTQKAPTEVGA